MAKQVVAFQFIGKGEPKVAIFASRAAALRTSNAWFIPLDEEELAIDNIRAPSVQMVALYNKLVPESPVKKFRDRAEAAKRLFSAVLAKVEPTKQEAKMADENNIPENLSAKMAEASEKQRADREEQARLKKEEAEQKAIDRERKKQEREAAKAHKKAEMEAKRQLREKEREEKRAAREAARAAGGSSRASSYKGFTLRSNVAKNEDTGIVANPRREGSYGHKSMQIIIDAGEAGISYEDFVAAGGRANDLRWDIDHGNVVVEAPAASQEAE